MTNRYTRFSIGDLCKFINGNGFRPSDWQSSGLPIIRIQNLNGSRSFNYFSGQPKEKWIVNPGDLLFAWAGVKGVSFGPTIWPGPRGVLNQHIFRVVPKEGVEKYWLYLVLQVATRQIEASAHGFKSSLVHMHKKDITNQVVNLPPLPEQRKIAEILSAWDRAIELTEALLAAAHTRKRGLMQILLTGKCRFPEFEGQEWREVRLGKVASVDQHSLGSKTAPDFTFDYISLSNVEPGRIVGPLKQVIFEKAPSRARRIVELGDLLISTVRPNLLGFARVTEEYQNCIASTGFSIVTPKLEADASYLFHYLFSHHMKSQFHSLVVGSNYPAINSSDVLKLKVRLSSVDEQHKIGAVLNGCDEEITALIGKIEILHIQKKALMQRLLTGEWRVKVEDPVV